MTLNAHPYAELFPMIEGEKLIAFAEDVKTNGQRNKIVLLDGLILDGRNRYRVAVEHDLPAAHGDVDCFRDFDPDTEGDPLTWVISQNVHRRHLDDGQRAMVADKLCTMRQGERTDLEPSANLPKVDQATAAAMLNVSARSVGSARMVREKGSPELVSLVEQGKLAVSAAADAAKQPAEVQARVVSLTQEGKANAARTAIKQGARATREAELGAKVKALPDRKFGVILADPEWEFTVFSKVTGTDRSPDNHYPTSSEQEISCRDVEKIAAKDCMLCLWTTDLARGIRVMEMWGFSFKSYFVWVKDIVLAQPPRQVPGVYETVGPAGLGFWNRDRDEILLIGTRGEFVAPAPGTQPESVIFAARPPDPDKKRGQHSAKPDNIHIWIEKNWPSVPKIELNARRARPGWEVWGYEAPESGEDSYQGSETDAIAAATIDPVQGARSDSPSCPEGGSANTRERPMGEPSDRGEDPQSEAVDVTGGESAAQLSPEELYEAAKRLVIKEQKASCSYVQRILGLSWNTTFAMLERMQHEGIVSEPDERNARKVLREPEARWKTGPLMAGAASPPKGAEFEIPAFLRRMPEAKA